MGYHPSASIALLLLSCVLMMVSGLGNGEVLKTAQILNRKLHPVHGAVVCLRPGLELITACETEIKLGARFIPALGKLTIPTKTLVSLFKPSEGCCSASKILLDNRACNCDRLFAGAATMLANLTTTQYDTATALIAVTCDFECHCCKELP